MTVHATCARVVTLVTRMDTEHPPGSIIMKSRLLLSTLINKGPGRGFIWQADRRREDNRQTVTGTGSG